MVDRDIVKRFPALEMLDNEPIVKVGFDAPTPHANSSHRLTPIPTTNSFPRPMAPPFIMGIDGGLVSGFLTRYFPVKNTFIGVRRADAILCD